MCVSNVDLPNLNSWLHHAGLICFMRYQFGSGLLRLFDLLNEIKYKLNVDEKKMWDAANGQKIRAIKWIYMFGNGTTQISLPARYILCVWNTVRPVCVSVFMYSSNPVSSALRLIQSKKIYLVCMHTYATFYRSVNRLTVLHIRGKFSFKLIEKWIVCFMTKVGTAYKRERARERDEKATRFRWITETVAQPFIRFQIRTMHIPFDYQHGWRVWVLLVASSLKSDWHRLLVCVCLFLGWFHAMMLVHISIDMLSVHLVCICMYTEMCACVCVFLR